MNSKKGKKHTSKKSSPAKVKKDNNTHVTLAAEVGKVANNGVEIGNGMVKGMGKGLDKGMEAVEGANKVVEAKKGTEKENRTVKEIGEELEKRVEMDKSLEPGNRADQRVGDKNQVMDAASATNVNDEQADIADDLKPVPILERRDSVVGKPSPQAVSTKPEMLKRPLLVMTKPSLDDGDGGEYQYVEADDVKVTERPSKVEPRTRRVSDVIDSVGDGKSLPSSPRLTALPGSTGYHSTSLPNTPRLPSSFFPDWMTARSNGGDSPQLRPMRANDATDAAPMNSSAMAAADMDDDFGPRAVIANLSVEKDSHEYNMNHARRGRAIIFNHDEFESPCYTARPGSEVDAKNLEVTFAQLHFEVEVYHNLEHAQIKNVINKLKAEDHSDADCLIVTVLTHGMLGGYVLSKDVPYPVDYLWHSFKADVCPTLAGKPKIFFIQACRGDALDSGVHMMRSQSRTQTDSMAADYKLPSFADFLVAHGTVDGHYAFRNPETGTWFIECLCTELRESGTSTDLLRLLTRTARRVAVDYQSYNDLVPWHNEMKQVPSITTMLIRDVYFRPKHNSTTQQ